MMCSINWRQKNPLVPQPIVWATCDCYTDVIREILTPEEIEGSKTIAEKELSKVLADKCNPRTLPVNPA